MVRSRIIAGNPRIDGREPDMVRALNVMAGVLPRTHGSSLFTRGETQALVTCTLGTERDAQKIDSIMGEYTNRFMLHYNFLHTQLVKLAWLVHLSVVKSVTVS